MSDEEKINENQVAETKEDKEYFVFKANVPITDGDLMLDWNKNCMDKPPIGYNNYRWAKMIDDHNFKKNFGQSLMELRQQVEDLTKKINELIEKKPKLENSDLFK